MSREIEYPEEYMEAMCSMYSNNVPLENIKENLSFMYPDVKCPCVETIKSMMLHLFGKRVRSTSGTDHRLYSLYLCKEVSDFIEGLPVATNKSELINSILLMFVRQYDLRKSKIDAEREKRLDEIEKLNRERFQSHNVPTKR